MGVSRRQGSSTRGRSELIVFSKYGKQIQTIDWWNCSSGISGGGVIRSIKCFLELKLLVPSIHSTYRLYCPQNSMVRSWNIQSVKNNSLWCRLGIRSSKADNVPIVWGWNLHARGPCLEALPRTSSTSVYLSTVSRLRDPAEAGWGSPEMYLWYQGWSRGFATTFLPLHIGHDHSLSFRRVGPQFRSWD